MKSELISLSRRRLFGFGAALLAAPAIVRVASLMPVSVMTPTEALITSFVETKEICAANVLNTAFQPGVHYGMDVAKFREILMPGLRDHFAKAYEGLNDEFDQVWRS